MTQTQQIRRHVHVGYILGWHTDAGWHIAWDGVLWTTLADAQTDLADAIADEPGTDWRILEVREVVQ